MQAQHIISTGKKLLHFPSLVKEICRLVMSISVIWCNNNGCDTPWFLLLHIMLSEQCCVCLKDFFVLAQYDKHVLQALNITLLIIVVSFPPCVEHGAGML